VLLAEDHEVIEALLLDRLNEPLHEGVRVRRPEGRATHLDSGLGQILVDRRGELGVAIVKQHGHRQVLLLGMPLELAYLLADPRLRGVVAPPCAKTKARGGRSSRCIVISAKRGAK